MGEVATVYISRTPPVATRPGRPCQPRSWGVRAGQVAGRSWHVAGTARAAGGDSGGSAFTYPNGSDTLAAGIVIGATAQPGTTSDPCIKSTAYDCAFFYMPIGRVKDLEPYQIRTTAGYVSPT
jgi:hypothetical protein